MLTGTKTIRVFHLLTTELVVINHRVESHPVLSKEREASKNMGLSKAL